MILCIALPCFKKGEGSCFIKNANARAVTVGRIQRYLYQWGMDYLENDCIRLHVPKEKLLPHRTSEAHVNHGIEEVGEGKGRKGKSNKETYSNNIRKHKKALFNVRKTINM